MTTVAVFGALLGGWFAAVPADWDPGSYAEMSGTFNPDPQAEPVPAWVEAALPDSLVRAVGRTAAKDSANPSVWRQFHLRWMVWSMFSPLVVLLLAPLWLVWVLRGCPGGAVLITTFVGHWLFLLLLIPVEDERFFISGMVAAVIAGSIGLAGLPGRRAASVAQFMVSGCRSAPGGRGQRAHAASISPDPLNPNYSAQVGQSLYLITECLLLISSRHSISNY